MKKISKFLLVVMLFTILSPVSVLAEDDTPTEDEETEEVVDDEETEEDKEDEEDEEVNDDDDLTVDEDNESPFLYDEKEENPDQSNREKEIIKKPMETPSSVTGEKYEGSGTVTDFTTTGNKAFYTVQGADNNIFYIVIDMDMTEDNVYFLSEINGEELSLDEVASQSETDTPTPTEDVEEEVPTQEVEETEEESSNLMFSLILIVMVVGVLGYNLFFGKLKNLNPLLNKNKFEDLRIDNKNKDSKDKEMSEESVYGENEPATEESDEYGRVEDDQEQEEEEQEDDDE